MTALNVLRQIDKLETLGVDGVCAMLGGGLTDASGAVNPGVGLDPVQVGMMRIFLTDTTAQEGDSNEARLDRIGAAVSRLGQIRSRIDLLACLEDTMGSDGTTAWDKLLALRANDDETWSEGGRPANLTWALDDIIGVLKKRHQRTVAKRG